MKVVFACLSAVLAFILSLPGLALAAPVGGVNLTTSPLPINLVAKPGSTTSTDLRVRNNNSQTERLKITLYKFRAYGDEGKPLIEDLTSQDEYKNWVKFSQNEFNAEPNTWKTIKMTISLPPSAAFGYYYAVGFSRADEAAPGKGKSAISGSTAVLVLLEAESPNAKKKLDLVTFSSVKSIYEFLPSTFAVKVRNSGNVHVVPHGVLYIQTGNKTVGQVKLNSNLGNVLPDSYRNFTADWAEGYPHWVNKEEDGKTVLDKRGNPVRKLVLSGFDISKLRFGKYTARMVFVYDNGREDIPLESEVSFWVIPWRFLLLLTGLLLLRHYEPKIRAKFRTKYWPRFKKAVFGRSR